jgi:hypothetical protein
MAKITAYIPEPTDNYDVNNQRQILESITTIKNQLNFGYQQDLINEQAAMLQFMYGNQNGFGCDTGTPSNPTVIIPGGTSVDAFGRFRVSEPFTLFDSQNRYAEDDQFSSSTTGAGSTVTFATNESSVNLNVGTVSGGKTVRQTFRRMPYQPGKSMLILTTFCMNAAKANLRQRIGYFDDNNGIFLEKNGTSNPSFTIRTNTSGTPVNTNTASQSSWNGDKLDGTGPSGLTLDLTTVQIFWTDLEWLGVGNVRCGFVINGQLIVCHTFQCANQTGKTKVYMETAILPVRYEIENTDTTATSSTLKQICSTVISEGGYQQTVQDTIARRTAILGTISTTFLPLVSIRLKSTSAGAVVLLNRVNVLPTTNQSYEICIMKNSTLTGASWTSLSSNMEYDVTATAMTTSVDGIYQNDYVTSSAQGRAVLAAPTGYNFAYQLGTSLAGVSDTFTLGIRTVSGATTGDAIGSISFYDLTI